VNGYSFSGILDIAAETPDGDLDHSLSRFRSMSGDMAQEDRVAAIAG
jgi:hypothetical protein